jgi:hypothetical protein
MKMAGRIRASWAGLGERLGASGDLGGERSIRALQAWLRDELPGVSRLVAEALPGARGVAFLLVAAPETLPITRGALAAFASALRAEPPVDPRTYVAHVDAQCWNLVLFEPVDDGCLQCQSGDLALWSDGRELFEVCDFLGCCLDARGRPCSAPAGLRPATRAQVLARFPDAPLVPWQAAPAGAL